MRNILLAVAFSLICACSDASNSPPRECESGSVKKETVTVPIDEIQIESVGVIERSSGSGVGAVIGAIGGGALGYAAKGAIGTAVGSTVGGAVGSYAGNKASQKESTLTTCRFRVNAWNEVLVFGENSKDTVWTEIEFRAYQKCTMLKQGEPLKVVSEQHCAEGKLGYKSFYWESGNTRGVLR